MNVGYSFSQENQEMHMHNLCHRDAGGGLLTPYDFSTGEEVRFGF